LQSRSFVYVEDLADGVVRALAPVAVNQTYNLVGSEEVTIRQIAEAVCALVGDAEIEYVAGRPGDFAGAPVARDNASALICPADGIAGNTTRTSASLSAALAPGAAIPSRASRRHLPAAAVVEPDASPNRSTRHEYTTRGARRQGAGPGPSPLGGSPARKRALPPPCGRRHQARHPDYGHPRRTGAPGGMPGRCEMVAIRRNCEG